MLAFARVALIRLGRDRSNIFFVVLFPLLLVLLLGAQFGGEVAVNVGVVGADSAFSEAPAADGDANPGIVALLLDDPSVTVTRLADAAAVARAIELAQVDAGLLLGDVTEGRGHTWTAAPTEASVRARTIVLNAIGRASVVPRVAAALAAQPDGPTYEDAVALVEAAGVVAPAVSTTMAGGETGVVNTTDTLGRFDLGASTQLLLFVFITALTGSANVVQARRWGVLDRALSGPTAPAQIIAGLALGQLAVLLVQSLVIVLGTTVLFGVDWGHPVATGLVIVAFAMVGAVTSLLLGSVVRTDEQAGGIGVPLGLGLAALGGSMVPVELFPDSLVAVSRLTPHAWGNAAFAEILRNDVGPAAVVDEVLVLLGFALLAGGLAAWRLRRAIATA